MPLCRHHDPMLTYVISETDHGRRLDSFLRNLLPGAPAAYLKKLLRSGQVSLHAADPQPGTLLRQGDLVTLKESGRTLSLLAPSRPDLDILYEDERIIAVNKPAGLAMHRTAEHGEDNLVTAANDFLRRRGDECTVRPVNRLDRGTSGAVLLAKSSLAAGMFGRVVKEEGLGKLYLALTAGGVPDSGAIDEPLDGKESLTRFRRLAVSGDVALLALYPVTGRMHQIRRHLQHIGYPVRGDLRYGGTEVSGWTGHALHSFRTHTIHPETGAELVIVAPLPREFISLLGDEAGAVLARLPDVPLTFDGHADGDPVPG